MVIQKILKFLSAAKKISGIRTPVTLHLWLQRAEGGSLFTEAGGFILKTFLRQSVALTQHVHALNKNKRGLFVGLQTEAVKCATRSPADCKVIGSGCGHFERPVYG